MAKTYKKKRTSKKAPTTRKTKTRRTTKARRPSTRPSSGKYKVKVTAPVTIVSKSVTKTQADDIKKQVKRREPKATVTVVKA